MSIQELLTYVEELSFKTSMIGYDKDEVDIQLDKICDEIEAIVKEKDDEIAALRLGAPISPVVVDVQDKKEETAEDAASYEPAAEKEAAPAPAEEDSSRYNDASMELEDLRDQVEELTRKLEEAERRAAEAEKIAAEAEERADEAEQRAVNAENEAEEAEARLTAYEEERLNRAEEAEEETAPQEEVKAIPDPDMPQTRDEAYQLYMKNADLLCRQLAAVDTQKEEVLSGARAEAEKLLTDAKAREEEIISEARAEADSNLSAAQAESEKILENARAEADQITADAEEELKEAREEAQKIIEDVQLKRKQELEDYDQLIERKKTLVEFMKDINTDITTLINKVQGASDEA